MSIRLIDRKVFPLHRDISVAEYLYTHRDGEFGSTEAASRRLVIQREDTAAVLLHVDLAEPLDADAAGISPTRADPSAPENGRHRLVFIKQFRISTFDFSAPDDGRNGVLIELIGGRVLRDERPFETAKRELDEETRLVNPTIQPSGLRLIEAEHIASVFVSPRRSPERLHVFYFKAAASREFLENPGRRGVQSDGEPTDEGIRLFLMTPEAFLASVAAREVLDAKMLVAAEWVRRNWDRKFACAPEPRDA